ncbi:MAG: hypothetical protein ACP6IY_09580 [Promethearchaeia archaeon]
MIDYKKEYYNELIEKKLLEVFKGYFFLFLTLLLAISEFISFTSIGIILMIVLSMSGVLLILINNNKIQELKLKLDECKSIESDIVQGDSE